MIDLTISIRDHPDAPEHVFRLVSQDGNPAAGTTLPEPVAALAAVERFGEDIFFPKPGPPRLCTQQYGGPQKAAVTGMVDGVAVDSSFARTNGCEISAWDAAKDVLGASGGAS